MDISSITNGFMGGIGKQVLMWSIGGAISIFLAAQIQKFLKTLSDNTIRKIRGQIANIEDENLRQAARHVVRYIANSMPNETGNKKLEEAVKKLQEITPDILVSDEKVKVLIESAYREFKDELKTV